MLEIEKTRKKFEDYDLPLLIKRTLSSNKLLYPSRIQEECLERLLGKDRKHLIGESENGTGKTLGFVVPSLSLLDLTEDSIQLLILSPTRELSLQIHSVIQIFTHTPKLHNSLNQNLSPLRSLTVQGATSHVSDVSSLKNKEASIWVWNGRRMGVKTGGER